jgi:hypothetical protein
MAICLNNTLNYFYFETVSTEHFAFTPDVNLKVVCNENEGGSEKMANIGYWSIGPYFYFRQVKQN